MNTNQNFRTQPPLVKTMSAMIMPPMPITLSDSGLRLHILHNPKMEVVSIAAVIAGGYAEASSSGIASLSATMRREGSSLFSSQQIASTLDFNGATLKTEIDTHHTKLTLLSLRSQTEKLIDIFADIVCCPTYPEHELSIERERLARNIEIQKENVSFLAAVESDRTIMGPHHPIAKADTPEKIRSISADDLRQFQATHNNINSIDIYLCGDIDLSLTDTISNAFSRRLKNGPAAKLDIRPFEPLSPETVKTIHKPDSHQSAVIMTLPAVDRSHPDFLPLHLTVYGLGGYFGSRLMRNIREDKGLTYGISAATLGYLDGSYIEIAAETDNSHVDRLIDEVAIELRRLVKDPINGDELNRMRQLALSAQAATLDSPLTIANHHISIQTLGLNPEYFNAKQRATELLSPETIADMANRYLSPEQLRTVIAGNPLSKSDL